MRIIPTIKQQSTEGRCHILVLSRQRDETIMIGDDICVTVVDIRGDKVRLGIDAPAATSIHRKEVYDAIRRENRAGESVHQPGSVVTAVGSIEPVSRPDSYMPRKGGR